jgi:hypothetical protein
MRFMSNWLDVTREAEAAFRLEMRIEKQQAVTLELKLTASQRRGSPLLRAKGPADQTL